MFVDPDEDEPGAGLDDRAGSTIQLGADFLAYARTKLDAAGFKDELQRRLEPTVPRRGRPRKVRPGAPFGKFELGQRLGKGGMAVVYEAIDPERGSGSDFGASDRRATRVALKVMKDEIATDPAYVRRFLREAANAALIDHRNVVRVLELGSVEGRLYFTMELIEGETLKDTLARGPLDEERGVQVLCQLVDGLLAAHARGIGHRDLKPSNIMLVTAETRYGMGIEGEFDVEVKITDFGLAQQLELDKSEEAPEGQFLGTAKYVAPEVIQGGAPTLKSDVFSLGVLAFQMFAGRAPFEGRSKLELIAANVGQTAPALDGCARVSRDLARVVDAMLRKDPGERPDAAAVRRDLGRLVRRERRGPIVVDDDPSSAFHRAVAAPGRRAPPAAPLLASAAAVLVLALAAAVFARRRAATPPDEPGPTPGSVDRPVVGPTPGPGPGAGDLRPPGGPPEPAAPRTVGGGEGLAPVPVPGREAFADQLAQAEFERAVLDGDAAWQGGDAARALDRWSRAEAIARGRIEALRDRVKGARRRVHVEAADAAEAEGEARRAIAELEQARALGEDGLEGRLERLRALLARDAELTRRLNEARALALDEARRGEAVAGLRALREEARALGREAEVVAALARLGDATPDAPPPSVDGAAPDPARGDSPGAGAAGEDAPERARAAALLARVDALLREGALDAAELALGQARDAGADVVGLARRLARARRAPPGAIYFEAGDERPPGVGAAAGDEAGFYATPAPVSNAAWAAWLAEAPALRPPPPRAWRGLARPPLGEEERPVTGVAAADAARFAQARGARLPTPAEVARLRAAFGLAPDEAVAADGRFERGLWLVRDPEGGP